MLKTRSIAAALLVLVLAACSADEPPAELPFQEAETDVGTLDDAADADPAASNPDAAEGSTTTLPEPEPVAIEEVWESVDIEPELADCYSAVFVDAGIDEVTDLRDFAERSAALSSAQQQAIDD